MIYTVTLNPAIDYVVQLDGHLTAGALNRSRKEDYQFGGKGINVSNVLRTLGQDTVALGFVAGFTGQGLEQGLQEMGLITDFIHLPRGCTRINLKAKGTEETEINGSGPVVSSQDMEALYARLEKLTSNDILVLSGSIPQGLTLTAYAEILCRLQDKHIPVVVDAAGPLLTNTLPFHPFLIKPNRQELEAIFQTELVCNEQIAVCATKLQQQGAQNVLVSLAEDGAFLLDETGTFHRMPCPAGRVINSVGAGDSMVAGFLAGWQQTGRYADALKLGIAAGSATAFSLGLADRAAIESLL